MYQLYPGGESYTVPTLASSLSNTTLEPDPLTNPLGIYARTGGFTINDNVTIRGTLIVGDTIHIHGDNVNIQPHNLPLLEGSSQPVQLPVMISGKDMHIENVSNVTVQGMATMVKQFEIKQANQNATILNWQGRIVCKELKVKKRDEWDHSSNWWHNRLDEFLTQLNGSSPFLYFPEWLEVNYGLQAEPVLTIKPESSAVTYHWQDWNLPIFLPHDNDDGLRWDVIRWEDNP
jgi:hypothetical protein